MVVKNTSRPLPKIRDIGRKARRVKTAKVADELGVESIIRLNKKDAKKFLHILEHPPKPSKRLKDAAKQFKKLFEEPMITAPEVCPECRNGHHIMHVIDELGDLHVGRYDKNQSIVIIEGHASNEPDHFWLRRILQMAYKAVSKETK